MNLTILSLVIIVLMIARLGVMAQSGLYWTSEADPVPPNMKKNHLFVDGVNPAWGQNSTDN